MVSLYTSSEDADRVLAFLAASPFTDPYSGQRMTYLHRGNVLAECACSDDELAVVNNALDNFTSCVDIGGAGALANNIVGSGRGSTPPNNQEFRLRQRQSTTVRLPGYAGTNNDDAAVVAFVRGRKTATAGNGAAANTVGSGGGGSSAARRARSRRWRRERVPLTPAQQPAVRWNVAATNHAVAP
jgi:hypothetical protein